jgi:hypothetical protein
VFEKERISYLRTGPSAADGQLVDREGRAVQRVLGSPVAPNPLEREAVEGGRKLNGYGAEKGSSEGPVGRTRVAIAVY